MTIFYIFLIVLVVISLITGVVVTIIEKRSITIKEYDSLQKTKVFEIVHDNNESVEESNNIIVDKPVINSVQEEIEILTLDEEEEVIVQNDIPVIQDSVIISNDKIGWYNEFFEESCFISFKSY